VPRPTFDKKNGRYIVSGAHDALRLRGLLDVFIEKFVLCESCKNPETGLLILKAGRAGRAESSIVRGCKACGARTGVDMQHKLTGFIVKNPLTKIKKGKNKDIGDAASSDLIDRVDPWRSSLAVV
jgi:translation initiation factor 5